MTQPYSIFLMFRPKTSSRALIIPLRYLCFSSNKYNSERIAAVFNISEKVALCLIEFKNFFANLNQIQSIIDRLWWFMAVFFFDCLKIFISYYNICRIIPTITMISKRRRFVRFSSHFIIATCWYTSSIDIILVYSRRVFVVCLLMPKMKGIGEEGGHNCILNLIVAERRPFWEDFID